MATVLVTGATGRLGSAVAERLEAGGHRVRRASRREGTRLDLASGAGLPEAVVGVDVIVHAASSPWRDTRRVDVEGTRRLMVAARAAGVAHVVYPGIVGVDRLPAAYYQRKLEAEREIEAGGVPFTLLRATQFHPFVAWMLERLDRVPLIMLVPAIRLQPVALDAAADAYAALAVGPPRGRVPDLVGPEILGLPTLARRWLRARGRWKPVIPLPMFRAGALTDPGAQPAGETFDAWLAQAGTR